MSDSGWTYEYLKLMERKGIKPNWWCSEEYFQKAGFTEQRQGSFDHPCVQIEDQDGLIVLPPIDPRRGQMWARAETEIWADLYGFKPDYMEKEMLDYEFIYDPNKFLNMDGGIWQTFRKNSRKYPKRNKSAGLKYVQYEKDIHLSKLFEFLRQWIDETPWQEIHDYDVMARYIAGGENREILIDNAGDIHGMNVWDENYLYINYRYCICLKAPFLSEYMRYLFYIKRSGSRKLVNDGGILDNPELKKFKEKLNPVEINVVYSWKYKTNMEEQNDIKTTQKQQGQTGPGKGKGKGKRTKN